MKKKLIIIISLLVFVLSISTTVFCTQSMGYYDRETESNNTIATADTITTERVMQGRFETTSDIYDYYKIYISAGNTMYAQLSSIPGGCDYNLYLKDSSGNYLTYSLNDDDEGEWIEYNITTSGYYYLQVTRYSGSSYSYYRLYTQVSGQIFNQSFYVEEGDSYAWMYCLGRDHVNNLNGYVFLSFGEAEKIGGSYYLNDSGDNSLSMAEVKNAVENFIDGYNENPKHTEDIYLVVSMNNLPSPEMLNRLSETTAEYSAHGAAFKNMVSSISASGNVTEIYAGIDAEMGYNTAELTRAWVDGYSSTGSTIKLYNFGSHEGVTIDYSGYADYEFDPGWYLSDIHYISWENDCSYCFPQIYSQGNSAQWAYQKKWNYLYYTGCLSTNGWDGLYSNQNTYTSFYNKLQTESVGQGLQTSWIAYSSPAQPN